MDDAVIVSTNTHLDKARRAVAANLEFLITAEQELDRTSRFLGNFRRGNTPITGAEFTAKPTADVIAMNIDVVSRLR